jgi:hypothetical protein
MALTPDQLDALVKRTLGRAVTEHSSELETAHADHVRELRRQIEIQERTIGTMREIVDSLKRENAALVAAFDTAQDVMMAMMKQTAR